MWIFKYLRADLVEIDMGPYGEKDQCQRAADYMKSLGATVTPVMEVPDDTVLYQGDEDD